MKPDKEMKRELYFFIGHRWFCRALWPRTGFCDMYGLFNSKKEYQKMVDLEHAKFKHLGLKIVMISCERKFIEEGRGI